jgi:serine/threonine-protein kinase RsbW
MNRFEFTLVPPEKDQPALLAAVERFAAEAGFSPALRYRLGLIVDELVSNCIVHGCCRGPDKTVRVIIDNQEHMLHITIVDPGPAFDPTAQAAPCLSVERPTVGGVGLSLVRHLVDEFHYTRKDGCNHLLLLLKKSRERL